MKVREHLYQRLVIQHEKIYKASQRIKKFKIYDFTEGIFKTESVRVDWRETAK